MTIYQKIAMKARVIAGLAQGVVNKEYDKKVGQAYIEIATLQLNILVDKLTKKEENRFTT